MVKYGLIQPPATISNFVKCFWIVENDQPGEFVHRSVALQLPYFVFHYKGTFNEVKGDQLIKCPSSHFQGQTKKIRFFSTHQSFGIFGVNFYPFVTPLLFNTSSLETTDQSFNLNDLSVIKRTGLEEKIMLAATNNERVQIIADFIEAQVAKATLKDYALQRTILHIVNSSQKDSVVELAAQCNLSKRQFERKFKEYSGFSPKLFSRIARFQEAYTLCMDTSKSLLDIAHSCGYYDQAHFNHDFKEFSGFQPGAM